MNDTTKLRGDIQGIASAACENVGADGEPERLPEGWKSALQLMCAAPDLLEACKEARKHLPGLGVLDCAIAKATQT